MNERPWHPTETAWFLLCDTNAVSTAFIVFDSRVNFVTHLKKMLDCLHLLQEHWSLKGKIRENLLNKMRHLTVWLWTRLRCRLFIVGLSPSGLLIYYFVLPVSVVLGEFILNLIDPSPSPAAWSQEGGSSINRQVGPMILEKGSSSVLLTWFSWTVGL